MAERNPYAMDPNLAAGFSNLSRALLGSAQDDASIAQANLANTRGELVAAQTATEEALLDPRTKEILANVLLKEAQANTSGQQGNYYSSQTIGQNIANEDDQNQLDAFNALSSNPAMMRRVEEMLGAPGVDASALVRAMFNLDSNSLQVQAALAGVGTDADNQTARTIQLDPTSSQSDILSAMAITDPTAFGSITNNNLDNKTLRLNNADDNKRAVFTNAADNKRAVDTNAATNDQSGKNNAATNQTQKDIAALKEEVGSEAYTEFLEQYALTVNKYGAEMMELPFQAMGWLEKTAMQAIRDDMKEDPSIIYGDAFNQNAVPMVAAGHMKVTFGYNFLFPKFVFDMHLRDGNRDQLLISAKEMGYTEEQIVNLGKQFDDARE